MYPGSQLRSYSHSIVDYDDPYINVGEEVENVDIMLGYSRTERNEEEGCKMVPNCVPKGSVKKESYHSDWRSELEEGKGMEGMTQKGGHTKIY